MGLLLFRHDVPAARSAACRRGLASDVAGAPGERTALLRNLAAAPAARFLLEARFGVRGLQRDSMSGFRRGRLDRCLQEYNSAPARGPDGAAQGSHRAVGARLSAFRASRPAGWIPPRDAAVVGLLAEGYRHRRDG